MIFILLEASQPPKDGGPRVEGFAVVWVDSARHQYCERAAMAFAVSRGLTVRGLRSAHRPTPDERGWMSHEQLAARVKALQEGIWGYFVSRTTDEALDLARRFKRTPSAASPRSLGRLRVS